MTPFSGGQGVAGAVLLVLDRGDSFAAVAFFHDRFHEYPVELDTSFRGDDFFSKISVGHGCQTSTFDFHMFSSDQLGLLFSKHSIME